MGGELLRVRKKTDNGNWVCLIQQTLQVNPAEAESQALECLEIAKHMYGDDIELDAVKSLRREGVATEWHPVLSLIDASMAEENLV